MLGCFIPYFARTGQLDGSLHKCDTKILQKIHEQAGFNQAGRHLPELGQTAPISAELT